MDKEPVIKKLYKKYPALEYMEKQRIFYIDTDETGKLYIIENCDKYFAVALDPDVCKQLSDSFLEMSALCEERANN